MKPAGRGAVDLAIVGSVGLDTIETPVARVSEVLGGSVSYAGAAASFFCRAGIVGVVGDDFPARHTRLYERFGLDLAGLERRAGKTFRWSGVYEADFINRRTLSTDLNVFRAFDPALPAGYRAAPCFLLGNISPELQIHVLEQARRPRLTLVDTMDLWIRTAREPLRRVIRRADILTVNDGEARLLAGKHNLLECGERLRAMGPRWVVIKKGEHGAVLFAPEGPFLTPAYPVRRVVDPTGAGDAFAGALMGALAGRERVASADVRAALLQASVVASFAVEDFSLGALRRLDRAAIAARLRALSRMTRV